jgi:hypothetical protein
VGIEFLREALRENKAGLADRAGDARSASATAAATAESMTVFIVE